MFQRVLVVVHRRCFNTCFGRYQDGLHFKRALLVSLWINKILVCSIRSYICILHNIVIDIHGWRKRWQKRAYTRHLSEVVHNNLWNKLAFFMLGAIVPSDFSLVYVMLIRKVRDGTAQSHIIFVTFLKRVGCEFLYVFICTWVIGACVLNGTLTLLK